MNKNSKTYLTKLEKKNPIGKILSEDLTDAQIVDTLKEKDFLTEDLKLTRRGSEYVLGILEKMDSVQRIMIERFILEHHDVDIQIEYQK